MIGQLSADGRPGLVIARRGRHCGNETDGINRRIPAMNIQMAEFEWGSEGLYCNPDTDCGWGRGASRRQGGSKIIKRLLIDSPLWYVDCSSTDH